MRPASLASSLLNHGGYITRPSGRRSLFLGGIKIATSWQ